jgi:hypothetical protein
MSKIVINIILFQIGWFACVLSAANNHPLIGASISLFIIFSHVLLSKEYKQEIRIIVIAMVIGLFSDSLIISAGWITYTSGMFNDFIAPYWIVLMWALFATTLNYSLSWLRNKLLISAVFGAIAGPLAYYAGMKLGAVEFVNENNALISLSIGWAICTPLLLKLASSRSGQINKQYRNFF